MEGAAAYAAHAKKPLGAVATLDEPPPCAYFRGMATDTTDLTIEISRRIQADQAAHRQETRALQQGFVDIARLIQRMDTRFSDMERRLSDVKSDLETMFKMELIGQNAHHHTHGADASRRVGRDSGTLGSRRA